MHRTVTAYSCILQVWYGKKLTTTYTINRKPTSSTVQYGCQYGCKQYSTAIIPHNITNLWFIPKSRHMHKWTWNVHTATCPRSPCNIVWVPSARLCTMTALVEASTVSNVLSYKSDSLYVYGWGPSHRDVQVAFVGFLFERMPKRSIQWCVRCSPWTGWAFPCLWQQGYQCHLEECCCC